MRSKACFHKLSRAPVWCFSFRSLFNLQGTRPTRNRYYLIICQPSCQLLILLFLTFFIDSLRLSTAALADSLVRLPHLSLLCNPFFHFSSRSYETGSSISLAYDYFHTQSTIVQPHRENFVSPCAIFLFTFTLLSDKVSPTSEHGNDGPQ